MPQGEQKDGLFLVRATVLGPVVAMTRRLDADPAFALGLHDLSEEQVLNPAAFIPHDTVYAALASIADITRPDICALAGQQTDLLNFLPRGALLGQSVTLGDFFTRFTQIVSKESNAVSFRLLIEDEHAYFTTSRNFEPEVSPGHSDAFLVGIWISLLHRVLDFRWDPTQVVLRLCDPTLLPEQFHGVRGIKSNNRGFSIRFPAAWLSLPINPEVLANHDNDIEEPVQVDVPLDYLEGFETLVRSRLSDPALTVSEAARMCSITTKVLNKRLSSYGTTASKVINRLRMEKASELLAGSDHSIRVIAQLVGLSETSALTRAFSRNFGMSPKDWRKMQSSDLRTDASEPVPPEGDAATP
ncbi:helix-turn-helix domain-containing protein [Tropicimonas sp. TH_r6]|uniref:helix-turn-helix domain-containing protein n=1 Tax=Tropicimonas sp. TH_r6 TaxID=3082085 RepID=UPI0029559B61|nr:helix-turn-helix domain-containing protein [Tropicimonas sp. TH_r6]MDV7144916.1 helix-turn-helix domain-containing protein [Tropicimonas sp. TH_r6]